MDPVFAKLGTTIFDIMSNKARANGAINLGQGFPEVDGFIDVRQEAAKALVEKSNQYPPMRGIQDLRNAVSYFYQNHQNTKLDADKEIIITSGATEALCASILSLVQAGDEVIVFEPMYDSYIPIIERAGGVPVIVQLSPPNWEITDEDLAKAFSDKTSLVIITTPNNPTTSVLSRGELELIAKHCTKYDAYLLSDEVWEQLVFDAPHLGVLHIPELKERAIKIGSAGKIFSLTGWKIGWVCACERLINQIAKAHQFITYTSPPALQHALAYGLQLPKERFDAARQEFREARDFLISGLKNIGWAVLESKGSYFVNVDLQKSGISLSGFAAAEILIEKYGIATIPMQAFCPTGRELPILRLCFAKSFGTLEQAQAKLEVSFQDLSRSN